MLDRRQLLSATTASLGLGLVGMASPTPAQVFPPDGFATPAGTAPFGPEVYRERRARLMEQLKGGIAVIYGAERHAEGMVTAPFVQNEDFAWLTGIVDEPGAALLLAPDERVRREMLFLPSRDPEVERWDVERLPLGSVLERRTGFSYIYRTSALGRAATIYAERAKALHYLGSIVGTSAPVPPELDLYGKVEQRVPGAHVVDSTDIMPALRVVKEPREIEQIKRAMVATRRGHLAAMRQVRPGWSEARLKQVLEAEFRAGGGEGLAYDSIVGSGRNAAYLHYIAATGPIGPNDLILIDAAASVGGYATDVTRTFPASGRFTHEQRALYELVLAAQAAAESKLKAGAYYEDVSEAAKDVLRRAGRIDDLPHGVGHFVGLNVHDSGDMSKPLPAGAVVTIEPGLYVAAQNYGIRIEDDYLVTADGYERLSTGIPRTVAEIERFMTEGR